MLHPAILRESLVAVVLAAVALPAIPAAAVEPEVELELILEQGGSPTAPQNWLPVLADAGFSRPAIRSARQGDRVEIVTAGSERSPVYQVRGMLTSSGNVTLPPAQQFSLRDRAGLSEWVRRLKTQGPEAAGGGAAPFGLTPSRLNAVRQDLRRPVANSTRGAEPVAALEAIVRGLTIPLSIDDESRRALAGSGATRDQLRGVAIGTALSALVRPAGLVLRPRFTDGRLEYIVADARTPGENWPIGWASTKSPGRLVPGLFQPQQTQDVEVGLVPALKELEGRVGAPFLFDYNSLAARRVDLAGTKVSMKAAKTYYGRVLSKVLSQARLSYEVRVDDADQPFLWISATKR